MKDSRLGVFGVLGIFVTGLFYFVLFSETSLYALLVFPVVGRACCLISASAAPYAREEGMGRTTSFAGGSASIAAAVISFVGASILIAPVYILLSAPEKQSAVFLAIAPFVCSLIAALAAAIVTVCITISFKKKLGGVTGDTFGAVIEISSVVYLLVFTLIY